MNSAKMNSAKTLILCFGMLLMVGCSTQPKKIEPSVTADSVIAQDFVNIMVQIDALSPWSTVLQFGLNEASGFGDNARTNHVTQKFGRALRAAAAKRGYAVQTVDSEGGKHYVRFSVSELDHEAQGIIYTYDLSVGQVDFRRVYRPLSGGRVEPYKAMLVRGADVSNLESDDSIFDEQVDLATNDLIADGASAPGEQQIRNGFNSPFAQKQRKHQQALQAESQLASTVTLSRPAVSENRVSLPNPSVPASSRIVTSENVAQPEPVTSGIGFSTVRKSNIAISGESNYENLLADKQNVVEEILIFGDDSYVLGARNKQILGNMMGNFNPDTDVISVVGCSTGVTKIANGNAALAIGRANRVKEALLYSGIPHDKIYDEGCWSPTANSTPFPNRGVVVTVKRNANKG